MPKEHARTGDRTRIARELHDGIAQDLVGIGYGLDALLANPETSVEVRSQLRTVRFSVTDLIDKVRREIYFLRQPGGPSLSELISSSAHNLFPNVIFTTDLDEFPLKLDPELTHEVHRIAEEILRNAAVHSKAQSIRVSLNRTGENLDLNISDDGVGGATESNKRYGIPSLQERARAIDGTIEIQSDAHGTKVSLRAPIGTHADQ